MVFYTRTYEEHVTLLRLLFYTAQDTNVSINKIKTAYAKDKRFLQDTKSRLAVFDLTRSSPE